MMDGEWMTVYGSDHHLAESVFEDPSTQIQHSCAHTSFEPLKANSTQVLMRTARKSGFLPFLCNAESRGERSCRRFLLDDRLLVFNHDEKHNMAAILPAYSRNPDEIWKEAQDVVRRKMELLKTDRLSNEEMVELSLSNATAYEEYIDAVRRNDTIHLDFEMSKHDIYDTNQYEVLFATEDPMLKRLFLDNKLKDDNQESLNKDLYDVLMV